MLKAMLISMPYTILTMPSIGIAQLQAVVHSQMKGEAQIDSAYCYLDFAEYVGFEQYSKLGHYEGKGLVEWMFRQAAFALPDNLDRYRTFFFREGNFPRKRRIFDLALEKRRGIHGFLDGLISRYKLTDYQVVGFTSMMSQNVASCALARRLKMLNPKIITLLGGPNAEHPMGRVIVENVPQIDYVFSGEALVSFPTFLKALLAGDRPALGAIKGVHGRDSAAARVSGSAFAGIPIVVNQASGGCGSNELENNSGDNFNLNELPLLDYTEYLARVEQSPLHDKIGTELVLPFQTSTGCWWADKVPCSFCGLTPHAFRQMSSEKARDYIAGLIERYSTRFTIFEATDPCMPVEYPTEVFPYVNQDKAATLQYEVKVKMPEDDLVAMARANVILPQPGIESLSTRTLKIMRKGVTAFHNVQFLKWCTEYGLYPIWNYLYGFPNTTYDELASDKLVEDMQTLSHLPPPSSNVPIGFQRYSEYFNEAEKYGLKLRPADHYSYIYPFGEAIIANIAYSFTDREFDKTLQERYAGAVQAINLEVINWMSRFRDNVPKLYFSDDVSIHDTRSGKPVVHHINETEREVLRFLDEPHSAREVASQFAWTLQSAEDLITSLKARRLLFSERDKHLNIVCEQCALTADFYKNYYINFVKNNTTAFF